MFPKFNCEQCGEDFNFITSINCSLCQYQRQNEILDSWVCVLCGSSDNSIFDSESCKKCLEIRRSPTAEFLAAGEIIDNCLKIEVPLVEFSLKPQNPNTIKRFFTNH